MKQAKNDETATAHTRGCESSRMNDVNGPTKLKQMTLKASLVCRISDPFSNITPKKIAMTDLLKSYLHRAETLVIYESPNRVDKTLKVLYEVFGNRMISIARELTKTFETIIRTDLETAVSQEQNPKG
jgi:16S rRNA C1402 (ribose-2'-O) methylase RsmI